MTSQPETPASERVAIILAAGEGKRMQSDLPKVLHPIGGAPMLTRVIDAAREAGFGRQVIVIGHGRQQVQAALSDAGVEFAVQAEQLGTGHAVEMAAPALEGFGGEVAVLCGDVPLLSAHTIHELLRTQESGGYAATVLTMRLTDPGGYGRIYRDRRGDVEKIVEQRDLPVGEAHPNEVNSGTYCFEWPKLRPVLRELRTDNDQGEYYLTDTIALLRARGERVGAYLTEDPVEVSGINSPEQLAALDAAWRERHPET
jgi:bifunctional UDP-N-acetylglucosamine pyrophosphorylase/glucosamine-1-phosphate N-acetyltransferase